MSRTSSIVCFQMAISCYCKAALSKRVYNSRESILKAKIKRNTWIMRMTLSDQNPIRVRKIKNRITLKKMTKKVTEQVLPARASG